MKTHASLIMAENQKQQAPNGVILNLLKKTGQFPKTHLLAVSACVAVLAVTLVLVPSEDVAAKRSDSTSVLLTPEVLKQAPEQLSAEEAVQLASAEPALDSSTSKPLPDKLPAVTPASPSNATGTVTEEIAEHPATVPEPAPVENWLKIQVRSGDNLTTLFKKAGLGANEMYPMLNALKPERPLKRLMPGQHLEFLITDGRLEKIRHQKSPLLSTLISRTEDGYRSEQLERTPDIRQVYVRGEIDQSLFLAGQKAGLSQKKIMELAAIFGWDVDFALDIRKGDSFAVIYEELLLEGKVIRDGNIVAAEFTNQGNNFRAIRYTDSKGDSNFYTPEGKSMRKAFLRTPVDFTRISSKFNPNRKHPIFKTKRPHRGVDYAAPSGTPIKSSGDGKVIFAGRKGGYGKAVIVQHGQKYTTLYAHMRRIKPGMKRGKRVKQGQVIGYVGSTGYATGPHLHYEFRVNGVHRNPLTVPLPQARPLPKKELAAFNPIAKEMLVQLETFSQTQLASTADGE